MANGAPRGLSPGSAPPEGPVHLLPEQRSPGHPQGPGQHGRPGWDGPQKRERRVVCGHRTTAGGARPGPAELTWAPTPAPVRGQAFPAGSQASRGAAPLVPGRPALLERLAPAAFLRRQPGRSEAHDPGSSASSTRRRPGSRCRRAASRLLARRGGRRGAAEGAAAARGARGVASLRPGGQAGGSAGERGGGRLGARAAQGPGRPPRGGKAAGAPRLPASPLPSAGGRAGVAQAAASKWPALRASRAATFSQLLR